MRKFNRELYTNGIFLNSLKSKWKNNVEKSSEM